MRVLIREPLVHFLLLGVLLLAGRDAVVPEIRAWLDPPAIRVTGADIDGLRSQWRRETGRPPDAAELRALVRSHVDEEILFREARRRGLHEGDPVVRRRLVRNLRFADPDTAADDGELLRTAYAMGMDERDPVVRRRLAQVMRHRIEGRVRVTEAEARAYHRNHEDAFASGPRYRFRQRFFAAGREAAAQAALDRLRAAPEADVPDDPFLLGERFDGLTVGEVERRFGAAFARLVETAPPGTWAGPVVSPYGRHLVHVEAVERGRRADYADVRPRVTSAVYAEHERRALRAALTRLRQRYRIEIEDPAVERAGLAAEAAS